MARRTALIAGATGAIGGALAAHLAGQPDWRVLGLCRAKPVLAIAGVDYIHADLADAAASRAALAPHRAITHVFYCGRAAHDDRGRESVAANVALLSNLLDAVEAAAPTFSHAHLVQGGKYYGVHLGPFPTPAREDDPRAVVANFYYGQEDLLRARATAGGWSWSASRPNTLLHFSPANARNLVSTLGAYAAICRELGAALDFPGSEGSYKSLVQVTTTSLLSRAMAWMATEPGAANNAFNVANGDLFRWERLWPRIAEAFGMACGPVRPVLLADVMAEREDVWSRIAARHGLAARPLASVANWAFADGTLVRWWDEIMSTNKARAHGFHDWSDSERDFLDVLARYRAARILP